MNNIAVKDRDIVLPGQLLGEGIRCEGPCLNEGDKSYSLVKGLARVDRNYVSVIPMAGPYMPKAGDVVIGTVDDDLGGIYLIDINGAYKTVLKPMRNGAGPGGGRDRGRGNQGGRDRQGPRGYDEPEAENLQVGDIISAKIAFVDEAKEAKLIGPRKLEGGCVIFVKSMRVPRIIGKQKSMINLIRQYTNSNIAVGQNGLIWIAGGNSSLAIQALRKVEAEATSSGLTDRMTEYLRRSSPANGANAGRQPAPVGGLGGSKPTEPGALESDSNVRSD
jgi:exosome complex component RRP4